MIAGMILAGGRSSRMGGGDKCLADLGGRPLLAHVIERLRPQVDIMALNANFDPERFADFGLDVIPDSMPDHPGPLAGVLAAMDWAAGQGAQSVVTVAADTPFFPTDLVTALRASRVAHQLPLAMAMTPDGGQGYHRHPTFGLWPVDLRDDLRAALADGTRKVIAWSEPKGCARAIFHDRGPDPFFNINTPEDLTRARARIKATGP
jgi:molybdopterin-guanine dinucleotide biosynthesis protein A